MTNLPTVSSGYSELYRRSGARSGRSRSGNGAGSGGYINRLERGATIFPRSRSAHMLCANTAYAVGGILLVIFLKFFFKLFFASMPSTITAETVVYWERVAGSVVYAFQICLLGSRCLVFINSESSNDVVPLNLDDVSEVSRLVCRASSGTRH